MTRSVGMGRKRKIQSVKRAAPAIRYAMSSINCCEVFQWCTKNKVQLKDGIYARLGDIVLCSDEGKHFDEPCDLGRVVEKYPAGATQPLEKMKDGSSHPDGAWAHVYVLTYKKQKVNTRKNLTG